MQGAHVTWPECSPGGEAPSNDHECSERIAVSLKGPKQGAFYATRLRSLFADFGSSVCDTVLELSQQLPRGR